MQVSLDGGHTFTEVNREVVIYAAGPKGQRLAFLFDDKGLLIDLWSTDSTGYLANILGTIDTPYSKLAEAALAHGA